MIPNILGQPDPRANLPKHVDARLGNDYPLDSVFKVIFDSGKYKFVCGGLVSALIWFCSQMAQLARACTHENPCVRPSMRSIVVALMTLSSSTED